MARPLDRHQPVSLADSRPARRGAWPRLPSRADEEALEAAARAAYGVPDGAAIVAAPGTQALIQWLPRLAEPGLATILGPTYSEHAASWRAAGHEVDALSAHPPLPAHARHIVVVNPNNPDGRMLDRTALDALAAPLRRAAAGC